MVARVSTVAFQGVNVQSVDVQVQISSGLPAFTIVGLPDKAVAESRERVRSALHSLGLSLPAKRLVVNLAPADIAKEGSHYDLPIALGLMAAMGVIPKEDLQDCVVLGELSLDSQIRWVAGVLPAALHAAGNDNRLICPKDCGSEAVWAGELDILAPSDLMQIVNHFKGTQVLGRPEVVLGDKHSGGLSCRNLREVKGQETAKRALEIAAAAGHNMLMIGPPGSGKSMLASCLPGILPPLTPAEALEVSMIHSLSGTLPEGGLMKVRPFRDPHHSASLPSLVGGGHKAKPGEISLAHCGVLFLDELPEFSRSALEALRQPLETGQTLVSRVNNHVTYPARFQLIAAMNPCRCGYLGDHDRECTRAPRCAAEYQAKISGPLLDRIDIQVDVPQVTIEEIENSRTGEDSEIVAARVLRARDIQEERLDSLGAPGEMRLNSRISGELLDKAAPMDSKAKEILSKAASHMKLSARGYHRMIRLARTIADLDGGHDIIGAVHISEAISYRRKTY